MCEKCRKKHQLGYRCSCECHYVFYGGIDKEKKLKGGKK